jgi:hypothetical protein
MKQGHPNWMPACKRRRLTRREAALPSPETILLWLTVPQPTAHDASLNLLSSLTEVSRSPTMDEADKPRNLSILSLFLKFAKLTSWFDTFDQQLFS